MQRLKCRNAEEGAKQDAKDSVHAPSAGANLTQLILIVKSRLVSTAAVRSRESPGVKPLGNHWSAQHRRGRLLVVSRTAKPSLFLISIHSPRIPAASFPQMKDFTGVLHCLSSVGGNPNLIAKPPHAACRPAVG